jgi:hypothetical protein
MPSSNANANGARTAALVRTAIIIRICIGPLESEPCITSICVALPLVPYLVSIAIEHLHVKEPLIVYNSAMNVPSLFPAKPLIWPSMSWEEGCLEKQMPNGNSEAVYYKPPFGLPVLAGIHPISTTITKPHWREGGPDERIIEISESDFREISKSMSSREGDGISLG